MDLNKFELSILNSVCDDYENLASIQEDLTQTTNLTVKGESTESLRGALLKLCQEGFVESFEYDVEKRSYVGQAIDNATDWNKLWFYIAPEGRKILNEKWE